MIPEEYTNSRIAKAYPKQQDQPMQINYIRDTKSPCQIAEQVREDILRRSLQGVEKYNTTVADNPLSLIEWHQHQYEELLDAAVYTKKIIDKLKSKSPV
jgi:hypothetical protein